MENKIGESTPPVLLHYVREMAWNKRSSIVHAFQNENKYFLNKADYRKHQQL